MLENSGEKCPLARCRPATGAGRRLHLMPSDLLSQQFGPVTAAKPDAGGPAGTALE